MNAAGTTSDDINTRPKRATIPSARLRDAENVATPELHSHQPTKSNTPEAGGSAGHESPPDNDSHNPSPSSPESFPSSSGGQKRKRVNSIHLESDLDDEVAPPSRQSKGKRVARLATSANTNGKSCEML